MDKYIVAKIGIHGAKATVLESNDITMGLTGAVVQLIYDDDLWQGMRKKVTFRGAKKVDVLTDENVVELPWEVTTEKKATVSVGITGVDAVEKTIIPTVWVTIGTVKDSPYGDHPAPGKPLPPEWAQVVAMIGDLNRLDTVDKSNLVAAVNEAMRKSGDGAGGYYTPIVTQPTANTMKISFAPSVATMPAVEPVTITLPGSDSGQNPPQDGEDGATFTPAVSEDGTLSWTNDKGLESPAPVNIKGPQGEKGPKGDTGATGPAGADGAKGEKGDRGEQGLQGIPGEKGDKGDTGAPGADGAKGDKGDKGDTGAQGNPGKDGANGKDGVSATHSWNGTTLTITSASGTSYADLKGAKGDKGDTGATGQRGTGLLPVTTAPSSYATAVGGITPKYRMAISTIKTQAGVAEVLLGDTVRYSYYHYPIDYLDASYAYFEDRVSIRGATGATGPQGPQGNPYDLTPEDKAEIVAMVIESLGGNPVFGYVDPDTMTIVFKNAPDGEYSLAYLKEDGTVSASIGSMVKDTNVYYTITNTLTNCTNSNSATKAVQGGSYSATITAKSGYELKSVTVTMGGSPVTVSGGKINIANVTGNIVITAVATEVQTGPTYTNQIPLSKDASGNLFNNGQGWKTGYRLGGDGTEKALSGIEVTGFIPISYGDTIYMKNITDDGTHIMGVYNSSHAKIGTRTFNNIFGGAVSGQVLSMVVNDKWATETGETSGVAYLRVSAAEITADSIITVNEPIV